MSRPPFQHRFPLPVPLRSRSRATAVVGLATVCVLGLTGCNDTGDRATGDPAPTRSSAASPSPTDATTESTPAGESSSAAPTSPATSAAASPASTPAGLAGRLPSADELPGFNADWRWAAGDAQHREGAQPFGTCQRFPLDSIGATDVARRSYRSATADATGHPDRGGALVAEFPDTTTARRAYAVLTAWHKHCADRLPADGKVGALENVPVGGGTGGWYLLTYPQPGGSSDERFFDAQGLAVVGNRVALVSLRLLGQDYDYEPGHEPMVAAVQNAAHKLA